ncbi:MAG: ABC transporter permease [Saprospiraceae bacterium]|nr:ABC transporter permease [Lewinella sp.]
MSAAPPKRALRFLRWFCREDYLEEIEGNLIELFENAYETNNRKANRLFYWNVLLHFRPDYIRSFANNPLNHLGMYKSYLKIAWRSMLKQKLYSSINIGGLAIGLTCFILIFLYVQHELSYDRFFANSDQIYRIFQKVPGGEYMGTDQYAVTSVGLAPRMIDDFPEVLHATTLYPGAGLLTHAKDNFYEEGLWADGQFFEVFQHQFIFGDPQTALSREGSMVLTESLAQKLFGRKNPIGEIVAYNNGNTYTVSAVIADLPGNASIKYNYINSIQSMRQYAEEMKGNRWNNNDYHTFFTLAEGGDVPALEGKLKQMLENTWPKYQEEEMTFYYRAQPLTDLHFEDMVNLDIGVKGNYRSLGIFSVIAVLVLLLACINYMSLAIARSIKRANEVGLRKVIGARRGQLIGQFLGESVLIAAMALVLALILTYFLLPVFAYLLDRPIDLDPVANIWLLPMLFLLVLTVGLLSGSYPAFLLSALRPAQILKGKIKEGISGLRVQRWLTVGQYAVSIALIIGSLVIYRQFQFIQNKELGYDKEQVITISIRDNKLREDIESVKEEIRRSPDIETVTTAMELPTNINSGAPIRAEHQADEDKFLIYRARVDYDYLKTFGIELIAGRDFSPDIQSDIEDARIINETAARQMGWTPEEAVGKIMVQRSGSTIIGVVKDFHMHSMHMAIAPMMLQMRNSTYFDHIAVKVRGGDVSKTIAFLQETIGKYSNFPFEYQFLNERFDQLYKEDQRQGEMIGFFTLVSILIASLGLFGMAAFTTRQRSREISIRKVLGASVGGLVRLLSRDFLQMVLLGFVLAIPLAWYGMNHWLDDFAYRIDLEWWMFAVAGLAVLSLAFFTVSSQSLHAALSNPAQALKSE